MLPCQAACDLRKPAASPPHVCCAATVSCAVLQAPLPAWLVAWDFSAPAAVLSVDGAAALNLSTPGAPLQYALASLPGAEALAPGATANASLHGSVPVDPGGNPGGAPLIARVSVNGVTCIGPDSATAILSASAAAAPAAALACGAAWAPAAGFAGGPGGPGVSLSAWSGASPMPGGGEPCALSFCCPDVPSLATPALGPAGGPSPGSPAGPGPGPELPPAPLPLSSAPAQQPVVGAVPVSSAPSESPASAPAPLEPPLAAGALADGQAQGARAKNTALVVGVAAAGATALALSVACVAALLHRAQRGINGPSDQQPPRSWPTTSAPVRGVGPAPAAPHAPAASATWAPSAAPLVLMPQQPAPCAPAPATPLQAVSTGLGARGKAGAGAAEPLALWPPVAGLPAIRVPVNARAGWLPRLDPNPIPCTNPKPCPRKPPHTALGLLTDLRALDAGSLSRRSTWPLAALAAAQPPQSPDSPWRPGSAPWPSAQVPPSQLACHSASPAQHILPCIDAGFMLCNRNEVQRSELLSGFRLGQGLFCLLFAISQIGICKEHRSITTIGRYMNCLNSK